MARKSGAKRHRRMSPIHRGIGAYRFANTYWDTPADGNPAWRRAQKRLHGLAVTQPEVIREAQV